MLKKLNYILSALIIIIAVYGFATNNINEIIYVMMLFLSLSALLRGVESFQKNERVNGWFNIAAFLFVLFVSIQGFLLYYGIF
ncbi:YczI family protein [Carnobacterium pleistocenium]|uniref:YczI family protein n=1 Tax=Carnobacterium pleistocenium TaxID=181073 RepID=UPI00054E515F|nr:YczI family protein [Carnobacterium pleistocenium]